MPRRERQRRGLRRQGRGEGPHITAREDDVLRARPRGAGSPQSPGAPADVYVDPAKGGSRFGDCFHRRRHTAGRRRLRRSAARAWCRRRHRQGDERIQGDRGQEHGAGRHQRARPRSDPPRDDASVQRRQQPRVPEAGCGGRRLHEARSRRHRRGGSAGRRADARALRTVYADGRADHGDGLRQRGADEVRRQRDAGDANLIHERDCQRLRGGGRGCGPCAAGDGGRSADRDVLPVSRDRLRRQLFPQGRPGAGPVRLAEELRLQDPQGGRVGERAAEDATLHQDEDTFRQPERQGHRRLGAVVQAENRRHA